jgi:aminoacylase
MCSDSAAAQAYIASLSGDQRRILSAFRDFLRIATISAEGPHGAYYQAADWLADYCRGVGLSNVRTIELAKGKPVVLATWTGTDPKLPSVLLNSHYDVVPVCKTACAPARTASLALCSVC